MPVKVVIIGGCLGGAASLDHLLRQHKLPHQVRMALLTPGQTRW